MSRHRRNPEPLGIVLIHGAAVIMDQRALVFLGPSGAGKSTISKILEPFSPVIGDDRLYLIPQGSNWFVADATNPALERTLTEEEARRLSGIPIGAVFRLFKSSTVSTVSVDARTTCRYLTSAFYEFYWESHLDIQTQKNIFAKIADISRKIPGFDLYFHKSADTRAEIRHAITVIHKYDDGIAKL